MKTYDAKCSKCNKIVEIRTDKTYDSGEIVGRHECCGGELVKIFNSSLSSIGGLSTPGRRGGQ